MKRFILFIALVIIIVPFEAGAEEIIQKGESLNLERCIEIALKLQPTIAAAVSNVSVNASRVGEAKSNYYPQINWTSTYDRVSSLRSSLGARSPTGLPCTDQKGGHALAGSVDHSQESQLCPRRSQGPESSSRCH